MNIELFLSLFAAAGLGSVLTVLVQHNLEINKERREKSFNEKKEAYVGLLRSLHDAAVEPSDKASKEYAYWQLRCELVSPPIVRQAIQGIVDTNDDPPARSMAYDKLKDALRSDLGIMDT